MVGWCQTIVLLVTAVVRSYNRADYLRQAIDSVLAQTRLPDQVVVVDDGSTDATFDVLASYSGAVEVLRLPHSGNPAAVLNAGLRAARGDLVAFLDCDDLWLPDKLARQVALLANPDVGFVYGNVCLLSGDGQRSAPVLRPDQIVNGCLLPTLVRDMCVHPSTLVVRRDLVGLVDERERVNEDFFLLLRLARVNSGACVPEPVALIRRHAGMVSTAHGLSAYTAAIRALSSLVYDPSLPRAVRLSARRSIGRYHTHVARQLVAEHRHADARKHALAGLANHPLHRPAWRWAAIALLRSFHGEPSLTGGHTRRDSTQ
jgi:glycosyltransferase involved in cell wall biosynthesis